VTDLTPEPASDAASVSTAAAVVTFTVTLKVPDAPALRLVADALRATPSAVAVMMTPLSVARPAELWSPWHRRRWPRLME
jgi:hypothetical protein